MRQNPARRPKAEGALRSWRALRDEIPVMSRSWRLKDRAETLPQSFLRDGKQWMGVLGVPDGTEILGAGMHVGRQWLRWVTDLQG